RKNAKKHSRFFEYPFLMKDKKIVLFDGVCNFCNFWVRFIFKYNKKRDIFFLPLQDEKAKAILLNHIEPSALQSVVFYKAGNVFTHSTAALQIARELNFLFRLLANIALIIPKKIRDAFYNFIAKRRYSLFGKKEACPLPPPDLKKQF